jgi:hypothetical protein
MALCEGERAEPVIEAVEAAIARHGKPEQMVVDGGSGIIDGMMLNVPVAPEPM